MAFITIRGIRFDTEDIDLLVMFCPMAELEAAIKANQETLASMATDDKLRPMFEHRLESHCIALDIAERDLKDGVERVKTVIQEQRQQEYTINKAIEREAERQDAVYRSKKAHKYAGIEL